MSRLLSQTQHDITVGGRIEALSRHFLGHPYQSDPLIGSATTPEVFTAALDGFDCVTYIESVVAMAGARGVDEFIERLRKIRYAQGRIQWGRRNHYMTDWIRNNLRGRIIQPLPGPALPLVSRERVLNAVPGLRARRRLMKSVPKRAARLLERRLHSGDLIFFASTRGDLDVFHAGIIVRDGSRILMRHASRSQGRVVEQRLSEFLTANRMAGLIAMRPCAPGRRGRR